VTIVVPKPGEVIRYSYLWHDEHRAGREEGFKDRPCAVVMSLLTEQGDTRLVVLPITHSPPAKGANTIEIPPDTKRPRYSTIRHAERPPDLLRLPAARSLQKRP
jgi:hypothetical protein